MFQEDEVGYLAGVLAGGMTKTGTVCTVSGMEIPPVVRYVTGYPERRQVDQAGRQDPQRLHPILHRSGQGQGNRPEHDRPGL